MRQSVKWQPTGCANLSGAGYRSLYTVALSRCAVSYNGLPIEMEIWAHGGSFVASNQRLHGHRS